MKRGEVWWVNFDPSVGEEIQKTRPALIISNDLSNRFLGRLQVLPLTSHIEKLYPGEAYVTLNGNQHKAMADQIATVSKKRLGEHIGHITKQDMQAVERAIKVQLALS
jgi:mRNA interferase MazF